MKPEIIQGDCIERMDQLRREGRSFDLIFCDPPFNLGKDYGPAFLSDDLSETIYPGWMQKWLWSAIDCLKPGGALWVYNLPKWNARAMEMLRYIDGMQFKHWVAVEMKGSMPIQGRLYPSHYSLLYFTKGKPKVFNKVKLPIKTCRHCEGEIPDYGGYRAKMKDGVNVSDVWTDFSPVRHKKTKTRPYNELPVKLIERVIKISTNEGDSVLDPFVGSGTTLVAAQSLGRTSTGIDLDVSWARARLAIGDTQ